MRFHALATDYDGTLARHGVVNESTLEKVKELKRSGRKLIMVTGRELPDLKSVFTHLDLFDFVVAENGALLYRPETNEERALAEPPPSAFVQKLRGAGVSPMSVGKVIIATWEPHQTTVIEEIRRSGLELNVIFNKGAVMILPAGVNKATGLNAVLTELQLSAHNVAGIGDAENDHAFLAICECSAAVANALPALKEAVDFTTAASHGEGVSELAEQLIGDDLAAVATRIERHQLVFGADEADNPVRIASYGENLMLAGTSGGGKTTMVTSFIEELQRHDYQACVIDPEGDYGQLDSVLLFGDAERIPTVDEIAKALHTSHKTVVVNLLGIRVADRPNYFHRLLPELQHLRARTGRPHWVVVDEAHHVMPVTSAGSELVMPNRAEGFLFVTVDPEHVAPVIPQAVDTLIAVGAAPEKILQTFAESSNQAGPAQANPELEKGEGLLWRRATGETLRFRVPLPKGERRRHVRKYAAGELGPDTSFYFTGAEGKLNLRAQNLQLFLQLAEGVDEETWMHHLHQGDYSRWFRENIKDPELADVAATIESREGISAQESRERIRSAIEERYTAPA